MNKSKNIQFILLFIALSVLICNFSSVDATSPAHNNTDSFDDAYTTDNVLRDDNVNDNLIEKQESKIMENSHRDKKSISKSNTSLRGLPSKILVSLETGDVTCNVGDVVEINVLMDPENITEGVLTLYVDDELVRSHNLSYLNPSYVINTSDYVVGVHDVEVEYSGSLLYESCNVYSNLIINRHQSYLSNLSSDFTEDNELNISFAIMSDDEYLDSGTVDVYYMDDLIATCLLESNNNNIIISNEYNFEVLTFKFSSDYYHESFMADELIYAKKLKASTYLPSLNGYYGSIINSNILFYSTAKVNDGLADLYIEDTLVGEYTVNDSVIPIEIDLNNYLEGDYEVFVSYCDSNVYEDSNYTTILHVNKIKTSMYLNNMRGYRNSIIDIKVTVSNYVDDTDEGMVELFIDGESIATVIVSNNSINTLYLIPDNLDYGQHNLSSAYYGSNRYSQSNKTVTLSVNKFRSTMYLRNTTLDDNGSIVVNLRLYSYENTVDDGIVYCFVNQKQVASSIVNDNECSIILPDEYTADMLYDVVFKYCDSESFDDCLLNTRIQQNKTNTTVSILKYLANNNIVSITSYVYSKDYSEINEGAVEFYINNTLIGISDVINNKASLEFNMSDYAQGNYSLKVKYNGSKKYQIQENTTQLEKRIIQKTIYINTAQTIKTTPNETIQINANLTDYESKPIYENIPAIIQLADDTINTTFINGYLNYTYQLPEHLDTKQIITIKTENTTQYKEARKNITLNIQRNNTYITSQNQYKANKLDEITLNFTLNSNNEILKVRTPAAIKVNNITIYHGFFNNGLLNYTLKLNTSYTQSQYTITAIAGQSMHYNKSTKDITLKLNDRKTYIQSQNIYSKKGDKIQFKATLYDTITKKVVTTPVDMSIKINNLTIITNKTNHGQLIYTYPNNFNKETYEITIKSSQTGIYQSSQWNGTLTNTREYLKVSTQNINAKTNSTINIKAKILKDNKLITSTIPVAIKINNITITNLNISNGTINYQYKLPDNLSQKEYNITIITGDTRKYIQSTTNSKLILTKNYQKITANNITAKTNNTIHIKAYIKDINDNNIKSNAKVNIKVAGKTIADINAINGVIDYEYNINNLKAGTYDLLIQTGETSCYYHATTYTTLKVE